MYIIFAYDDPSVILHTPQYIFPPFHLVWSLWSRHHHSLLETDFFFFPFQSLNYHRIILQSHKSAFGVTSLRRICSSIVFCDITRFWSMTFYSRSYCLASFKQRIDRLQNCSKEFEDLKLT